MSPVYLTRSDTRFMCAICFDWTLYTEAYIDNEGAAWDMCAFCGAHEAFIESLLAAGIDHDDLPLPVAFKTWTWKEDDRA